MDWKGIHVLESYKRAMDQSREDMIGQAWGLVNASYELADQAQLGLGLQVKISLAIVVVRLVQEACACPVAYFLRLSILDKLPLCML